ncbi:MAG TPA: EthD family reductase [Candidatus Sulfotelmatobacter sp.]|nr:EthD family reductase [Candidatus Sulfotelmatobacter sp.]
MLKFMVVLYRRPDLTPEEFRRHLEQVHGPLAMNLPGLRKYSQNYVCSDSKRKHPGWDAIVELYFDDRAAMEAAWASPQGAASDADLPAFADLTRTTWSVMEEVTVLR